MTIEEKQKYSVQRPVSDMRSDKVMVNEINGMGPAMGPSPEFARGNIIGSRGHTQLQDYFKNQNVINSETLNG